MELFAMGVTICLLQWSFGDLSVDGILCGFYTRQSVLFSFKPEVPCRITNKLSHTRDDRSKIIKLIIFVRSSSSCNNLYLFIF